MPIKTWDTKADWDGAYELIVPGQAERGGYQRRSCQIPHYAATDRLVSVLGLTNMDTILIVGCAFGWMLERFIDLGFTQVWGTDTSAYIQAQKVMYLHR
jgi:hypothetical protein